MCPFRIKRQAKPSFWEISQDFSESTVDETTGPSCLKLTMSLRGMFEMNCLLSSSSISTWGTIKTNTYLYRAIQYLHNGI